MDFEELVDGEWTSRTCESAAATQTVIEKTIGLSRETFCASALLRRLTLDPPWSPQRFSQTARAIEQNYRTNPIQFRAVPGALMTWENLELPPGDPRPAQFERALRYTLPHLQNFAARFDFDKLIVDAHTHAAGATVIE